MATTEANHGEDLRVPDEDVIFINQKEVGRAHPHVAQQAWTSSEYQGSLSIPSHDPSRVTRDSTFNARNPGAKLGKPDEVSLKSLALTRSGQPGLFDDCDSVPRLRTKRRNSLSAYLPSRGVNNTQSFTGSDSYQSQASRNSFHQVYSQKFQSDEIQLQGDASCDQNCNDINQLELSLSRDLTGGRRVSRRHSVASLSESYSLGNLSNFDQTSEYFSRHGNNSEQAQKREFLKPKSTRRGSYTDVDIDHNLVNSGPWCQKQEPGHRNQHGCSTREPQSGQNSSARKRRRASCSVISDAETKNIVQQSDEGLQDLIHALRRDINPQNCTPPTKVPEKSNTEFRNRIPIAKESSSLLISNQNLLSGSQVQVQNTALEHSRSPIAIHLPDSGACSVTQRQESVKRRPSFKDTHISLVYSRDFNVDDSLEDVLKCAQSGLGANFSTDLFKNEKKHNLVNSQGHTKVNFQGQTVVESQSDLNIRAQGCTKDKSSTTKETCYIKESSKTASESTHLNKVSSTRNLKQNKTETVKNKSLYVESKSAQSDTVSEESDSCSESEQSDICGEKGLTHKRKPSPGHENKPSLKKEHCDRQIEVDRAEGINYTGGHEANGTCVINSETSKKLSRDTGIDNFCLKGFGNGDVVVPEHKTSAGHCVTISCDCEDLSSETKSFDNDYVQSGSWNNSTKGKCLRYSESESGNTPFGKGPVKFEPRSSTPGRDRPRSYSLDSGTQELVRLDCVASEDDSTSGSDLSDVEPSSIDSESSEESVKENKVVTESSPKETKTKKISVFSKIRRSLTAPDALFKFLKKPVRKTQLLSSNQIYTISEEISPEGVSVPQEENQKTKLHGSASERPKSVSDEAQLDEAFETFAETAKQRLKLREKNEGGPESSVSPKKVISLLRRKSLYDAPEIFEKFVSVVDKAGDIQSQESIFSSGTTGTSDSVFEQGKSDDISSTGETDNEDSESSSEDDTEEYTEISFFNRFSAARTSVRRASIDFGCLDLVNRAQKGNQLENISVSASLSDHNLEERTRRLNRRCSDGRIMGYAMAQNQSSQNTEQTKMVAKAGSSSDAMREFGRHLPNQDSDQLVGKIGNGKSVARSDSDSSAPSAGDAPQPSRTAQVLANPSIRRYLLQSQARPSSRPGSRSSSPGLTDSGPQSPKSKNLLSKTEFFFSSSENSPNDSPRGSVSEYSGDSLKRSFRKDTRDTGPIMSRLHQRRSSSEMNLDQIGLLDPGKVETSKSGRSLTDPFPERSRSPREILELSQRSYSEASDNPPDMTSKHYSDPTFQDIMKRSSLKSKFHIPTFEEFKLKKKTTFSSTLDYIGQSRMNQSKSSSHQPIKGVHSKLLVEQVRHARSMTALHELDKESEDDELICSKEGASNKCKQTISGSADAKIGLADGRPKDVTLNENVVQAVQNSGCGTLNTSSVLKAPPRRRHRSSDSRKSDEGLSPRGGSDASPRRPKSMYVDGPNEEVRVDLRRTGSEQMLASESSYAWPESQTNTVCHKTPATQEGSLSVPGVTVTESDVDACARPKRPDRKQRKKSKSMIEISKTDLDALQQAHQGHVELQNRLDSCERSNSERATTKSHRHRLRSESSEGDLDLSQGHKEKHKRHKSGEKVSKTKSEAPLVELVKDGHRRSKSEKAHRVKESCGKRHQTDTCVRASDFVDGGIGKDAASNCNSQHLKLDLSAMNYDSSSPVPSPRDDEEVLSPRARKSKSRKSHKSSAKSSEDLANNELSVLNSAKKLLKAHSMDNLNVLKKHSKQDKDKKVKGQRPVSMGIPVNIDFEDEAIGQEVASHVRRTDHGGEHRLRVPYDTESKSIVTRSTSDVSDVRKEEKRRQKNKKIRSSNSDPFDEKGRRSQPKLREARSHQQLVPDSSDTHFLESSHSFQSIGNMDEEDDTSTEVPVKKSSGRKPKKTSNVSTTSVDSGVIGHDGSHDNDELSPCKDGTFIIDVERVDSGVGSETKYTNKKERKQREGLVCVDCDKLIPDNDDIITEVATICKKCLSRRTERKETIQEIIETEVSYGRDLKIIKEEFYTPMQKASLLTSEQIQAVFLNFMDLMDINDKFADFLQDAIENANEQGDEDYHTVQIGKIFLDFSFMFIAFENYCVNQSSASLLLEQMEKERELLRIFLRVSQRDNQLLRRMNLKSFLMVPVQRIVKYPLLLTRLYKSTPLHNTDRALIKEAQLKIEEILDHINASAKGGSSGTRARTKGSIMRRGAPGAAAESVEIQKVAFETIGQNRNDAFCVIMGRLSYATPTEQGHWTKKGKGLKFSPLQAVVLALGKNKSEYSVEEDLLLFPKKSHTTEALMVLLKEKNGKYVPAREPLSLDKCVVCMDPDFDEVFEVHEINKETLFFKADETKENVTWVRHLKYQAKGVGAWRRRRHALANIMFSKA
ncbi:uncharacterized protein LOC135499486 isoform X2 [Lineus longissimus]|uniref:uncharacterized protein LOC135499486 isoform X2 n=1 Tax=Lineus longissimus TaxID=88925 RepID=UPI002B4DC346